MWARLLVATALSMKTPICPFMEKDTTTHCSFSDRLAFHAFIYFISMDSELLCDWEVVEHLGHHPCWLCSAFSYNLGNGVVLLATDSFIYFSSYFVSVFLPLNFSENLSFSPLTCSFLSLYSKSFFWKATDSFQDSIVFPQYAFEMRSNTAWENGKALKKWKSFVGKDLKQILVSK